MYAQTCLGGDALGHVLNAGVPEDQEKTQTRSKPSNISAKRQILLVTVKIWKGVCQGCILSPWLFNLYAEYTMRNAGLEEAQAESRLLGEISITSDMQMTPPL